MPGRGRQTTQGSACTQAASSKGGLRPGSVRVWLRPQLACRKHPRCARRDGTTPCRGHAGCPLPGGCPRTIPGLDTDLTVPRRCLTVMHRTGRHPAASPTCGGAKNTPLSSGACRAGRPCQGRGRCASASLELLAIAPCLCPGSTRRGSCAASLGRTNATVCMASPRHRLGAACRPAGLSLPVRTQYPVTGTPRRAHATMLLPMKVLRTGAPSPPARPPRPPAGCSDSLGQHRPTACRRQSPSSGQPPTAPAGARPRR